MASSAPITDRAAGIKAGQAGELRHALHEARIGDRKAQRRQPRAPRHVRRRDAIAAGEGGGRHQVDAAARRGKGHSALAVDRLRPDEGFEEGAVLLRLVGDNDGAGNAGGAVGVFLEGRVPEVLRIMLLADGEVDVGRQLVLGKGEREGDLDGRAVRPLALALEAHGFGSGNAGGAEGGFVGLGVVRLQDHQRQPLPAFEEVAGIGAEQTREAVVAELVRLGQRQQLDEEAGQLHEVIMGAPRVPVAGADGEAEAGVKVGGGGEIAHRMHTVIEPAGHRHSIASTPA